VLLVRFVTPCSLVGSYQCYVEGELVLRSRSCDAFKKDVEGKRGIFMPGESGYN
jgi:hypothetical protein